MAGRSGARVAVVSDHRRLGDHRSSHPGRGRWHRALRQRGQTRQLPGVAPLDASSGRQQRHRLNRAGNRRLNRALYTIALTQIGIFPPAREYMARRAAEGDTPREAMRTKPTPIRAGLSISRLTINDIGATEVPDRPTAYSAPKRVSVPFGIGDESPSTSRAGNPHLHTRPG
ncbi:transposase [Solirubrobacter sp. CPCC 204708]|nr:transposase [Solirubrobacter deserti]